MTKQLHDPDNPNLRFRFGVRKGDGFVNIAPFDLGLDDVGRLSDGHNSYVRLQHRSTGVQYARPLHADVPHLIRIFKESEHEAQDE